MDRRLFGYAGLGFFAGLTASSAKAEEPKAAKSKAAESSMHRVAFQISSEERRAQELALGNVRNYAAHYRQKGEPFEIEIIAFGPGFSMVRGDLSMMKGAVETLQTDLGASLKIAACRNTRQAIAESMGKKPEDIPLLPGVGETPSGVVRLAELQEQGWAYVRP